MRRNLTFFVAGAVALLLAAPAPAKTVTVDISKLGFVPNAVTIQTGDAITWTNKDTGNHQVVCTTCPFTSNVLKPGDSYSYTFAKVGKFTTVDPLNGNKKATVTVKAAPAVPATVSLSAAPTVLTYGHATTVTGTLSTGASGQKIEILAQACGGNAGKVVATVTTTSGGAYTYQAQPAMRTVYQARYKPAGSTILSSSTSVAVRPALTLTRIARGKFSTSVAAAQSFVGKVVAFQRYVSAKHRWSTVRSVFLTGHATAATPLAGTTVSSATFKVRLKSGVSVRAVLPPGQAAPCYLAADSGTIRS